MYSIKNYQIIWDKRGCLNKWCCDQWAAICIKMKLDSCLTPYTKINSECTGELNIKNKTIQVEKAGEFLQDLMTEMAF